MKTDLLLGLEVHEHLKKNNVETPMVFKRVSLTDEEKQNIIIACFAKIMDTLGMDLDDDSLIESPIRVAKMYTNEIFSGLNYENFPKCTTVENKMKYNQMVLVDRVNVQSVCEHHFVTIDGFAKVAYIPKDKVLGLSKINRIVKFFSQRPQIQERLTEQIMKALCYILETEDVAVKIKATHFCVKSRGIQDTDSDTTTCALGGVFIDGAVRNEFLSL